QNPVSISVANFYKETESSTILCYNAKKIPDGILSLRDILHYIYRLDNYNGFHIVVWNKLYDANLFLNNRQLLFNEKIKGGGEDVLFLPEVFILGNCTAVYTNTPVYHYLQRSSSYVHSGTVTEKENGSLLAHKMVLELFDKHGYSDLNILVRKEICYYASLIAELAIKTENNPALKRMQKTIDKNLPYYIEIQGSYPERVERIKNLLNHEL
ncbi:MAG: hypothetical protein LBC71_02805, partial [Oscillospiraceae bacterium]|nr:hypothetical protein [Oscillospiraceae bacterium]